MPDWSTLNEKTREFRARQVVQDAETGIFEVVFCGLEVRLSEVLAGAPAGGATSLTIYADTLVVDVPSLNSRGTVVMARSIDVRALDGGTLLLPAPPAGTAAVVEIMAQETVGGTLQLAPGAGDPFTVPVGSTPLQAAFLFIHEDGTVTTDISSAADTLWDVAGRPWALNALRSSYTAATWLALQDDEAATAQSMLAWTVACARVSGQPGTPPPSDYAELYSQAAALLVTLNVSSGAFFVPVLSGGFYADQAKLLIDTVQAYEEDIRTLTTSADIKKAVEAVSATLGAVAENEAGPLRVQLDQARENITALQESISQLRVQFLMQEGNASALFAVMQAAIKSEQARQFFEAALLVAIAPYKIAADIAMAAEGDATAVMDALETFEGAVRTSVTAIQDVSADPAGDPALLRDAKALLEMQVGLMTSVAAGGVMWARTRDGKATGDLPRGLAAVAVDPDLAWNNYLALAEADVAKVRSGMEDPATAEDYLAGLRILVNYGKAISACFVALAGLMAQATVLQAQIAAAESTVARWKQLQAESRTEEEKLAALKGLVQGRIGSVRRSVYVSWTYYRDAYFYLYFKKPPVAITLDMTAAQMRAAFAKVSQWIAELLGESPDGKHVRLPSTDVKVPLEFEVLRTGTSDGGSTQVALLTPRNGKTPATLSWTLPIGTEQLQGVLPHNGDVAIWIKSAEFFVEGVQPNRKGNVIAQVATSGTYQNGYGPEDAYNFVTQGLVGDYAYRTATGEVYSPWKIDVGVYMTPTPFTQWTMTFDPDGGDPATATRLKVKLEVAYRGRQGGLNP
jgi:hypothetical protein